MGRVGLHPQRVSHLPTNNCVACLPACLPMQKLGPMLEHHSASLGDVLMLQPLGPGRLRATVFKADSEVG
jgi:hypothetical protein